MKKVPTFSEIFFVLRAPWIKPRRMHPTFMRGILIVSEIKIQVARDPELNPGNHIKVRPYSSTQVEDRCKKKRGEAKHPY